MREVPCFMEEEVVGKYSCVGRRWPVERSAVESRRKERRFCWIGVCCPHDSQRSGHPSRAALRRLTRPFAASEPWLTSMLMRPNISFGKKNIAPSTRFFAGGKREVVLDVPPSRTFNRCMVDTLTVSLGERSYPIRLAADLSAEVRAEISRLSAAGRKVAVLTDANLVRTQGIVLRAMFGDTPMLAVEAGEGA